MAFLFLWTILYLNKLFSSKLKKCNSECFRFNAFQYASTLTKFCKCSVEKYLRNIMLGMSIVQMIELPALLGCGCCNIVVQNIIFRCARNGILPLNRYNFIYSAVWAASNAAWYIIYVTIINLTTRKKYHSLKSIIEWKLIADYESITSSYTDKIMEPRFCHL